MILKIVINKTDYTSSVLSRIAGVLALKTKVFVESEKHLEGQFLSLTKLAQADRIIKKIIRLGSLVA